MTESEAVQLIFNQAVIQAVTAVMMTVRDADANSDQLQIQSSLGSYGDKDQTGLREAFIQLKSLRQV